MTTTFRPNLLANRQCRQQLVVSSTAKGCASRGAIRRCCQCDNLSKEKLDCSLFCAEPFASFRRHEKKRKERLEEEYKSKLVYKLVVCF